MKNEIAPDMSPFDKFKVGDAVSHISCGNGVVAENDGLNIHVAYTRPGNPPSTRNWTGIYDAKWFELHPKYLFHRS